ncbi:peptidase U61, LD-carboxypeptidase A [Candidatus Koribacter versatilis Ellin345]|uniref:Peptidase U61, LD-carboxypeptidase A n=1 Tax=Koribacter versatilis (strain Ellin345) TaxID=204669 RepID=Q1INC8_KORVE|nr:LD-carboxypeptidase [Candidatus Koribacter versatilis]ABF41622.1 peptidase U61, LD-carboxypeptidase A [Candidatus Koribacter versatilis Ellin345]
MAFRMPPRATIRPPALLPGDTVGIVAPASNIDRPALLAGCAALERMGYKPYFLESIVERDLYFAGSIERRVAELEHMFANPEVRAIVCARGGYGVNYLLPKLPIEKLLANPKPFVGYSDITVLLTWLTDHGLVTFHGPMVTKDFGREYGIDLETWMAVLGNASDYEHTFSIDEVQPLVKGSAEGVLYGGCLSLLAASMGTPYEFKTEDTILFLEDVNEKPFQIDRMLRQLLLAGKFKTVRAFVFGEMLDCQQPHGQDYTLQEVILRILAPLGVPVAFGLSSGHVRAANRVLPFGVCAKLEVGEPVRLRCEAAVAQGTGAPRILKEPSKQ